MMNMTLNHIKTENALIVVMNMKIVLLTIFNRSFDITYT